MNSVGIAALTACLPPNLFERLRAGCAHTTNGMGAKWYLDGVSVAGECWAEVRIEGTAGWSSGCASSWVSG